MSLVQQAVQCTVDCTTDTHIETHGHTKFYILNKEIIVSLLKDKHKHFLILIPFMSKM